MTFVERRAKLGAQFLDKATPGWAQRINKDTFDMSLPCCCAMGQLFGYFPVGLHALGIRDRSFELGFHLTLHEWHLFDRLNQAWRNEVEARLAA